jgi:hypothetical protein
VESKLNGFTDEELASIDGIKSEAIMSAREACQILSEVEMRIRRPSKSFNGADFHVGGCYWRLMRVLYDYVIPNLHKEGGHKFVLLERFGAPVEFCNLNDALREEIKHGLKRHHATNR